MGSPDLAEKLATYALLLRFFVRHDAAAGAEDRNPHARADPRNAVVTKFELSQAGYSSEAADHFEAADTYLSRALELDGAKHFEEGSEHDSRTVEELAMFAQARLWRALTAKRLGDEKKSQAYLVELVDHTPSARESQWVNREESLRGREKGGRGVASDK